MFVKCIDANDQNNVVVGQVYELINTSYRDYDDSAYYYLKEIPCGGFFKWRFVVLKCPCGLKNCLAHR